jgi:hypothetical protein
MKKVMLLSGLLFVPFNTFAGTCANRSLSGTYNYNLPINNPMGRYNVGRIDFSIKSNGNASVTVSGEEGDLGIGSFRPYTGHGTYSVSKACVATVIFNAYGSTPDSGYGSTITMTIYLDQMDDVPATRLAYHGNVIYKSSADGAASGTIDRVIGKFQ